MLQLPVELQAVIAAGLVFVVTEGLKVVSGWIGQDLSGFGAAIAAALVTVIVAMLNGWLSLVPAQYAETVAIALTLLVSILGAFGVHGLKKQADARR